MLILIQSWKRLCQKLKIYLREMQINIFILCFNEQVLLPRTIKFYKTNIPSCQITILDNESTDNSVEIALQHGCKVITWTSNYKDMIDDIQYRELKNNCWKGIKDGWIIMIDMDEWLCVNETDLQREKNLGTTILSVEGVNMIGESSKKDLSDIKDLNREIVRYQFYENESKNVCFLREYIDDMNYTYGAHKCFPQGRKIQYSRLRYYNKHMLFLGYPYYKDKQMKRYKRSGEMRVLGLATHYSDDKLKIKKEYEDALRQSLNFYFIDFNFIDFYFIDFNFIDFKIIDFKIIDFDSSSSFLHLFLLFVVLLLMIFFFYKTINKKTNFSIKWRQ